MNKKDLQTLFKGIKQYDNISYVVEILSVNERNKISPKTLTTVHGAFEHLKALHTFIKDNIDGIKFSDIIEVKDNNPINPLHRKLNELINKCLTHNTLGLIEIFEGSK